MNFFPDVWDYCTEPVTHCAFDGTARHGHSRRTHVLRAAVILSCSSEGIAAFWRLQCACAPRHLSIGAALDTAMWEGPISPDEPTAIVPDRVPTRDDIPAVRTELSSALYEAMHRRATAELARRYFSRPDTLLALLGRAALLVERHII